MTKIHVNMYLCRMLSVTSAYRLRHRASGSAATVGDAEFHHPEFPCVLIVHGAGGNLDVNANAFGNALISFHARDLTKARKDSIVLIRHREYSKSTGAT